MAEDSEKGGHRRSKRGGRRNRGRNGSGGGDHAPDDEDNVNSPEPETAPESPEAVLLPSALMHLVGVGTPLPPLPLTAGGGLPSAFSPFPPLDHAAVLAEKEAEMRELRAQLSVAVARVEQLESENARLMAALQATLMTHAAQAPPTLSAPPPPQPPCLPRFLGIASDRAKILSVSEDGLLCTNTTGGKWAGARCVVYAPAHVSNSGDASDGQTELSGGVYYFEVEQLKADTPPSDGTSILRVGFSTASASLALGTDDESFGYGGTGMKCSGVLRYEDTPRPGQPPNSAFAPYGTQFGVGDVVGALVDRTSHTISFSVNGVDHGTAFQLPPALERAAGLYPSITIKGCAALLNLGQSPLKHLPPSAQSFAAAGRIDEHAMLQNTPIEGTVIGRGWATANTDTSAHLINSSFAYALS